jgi:hypothetical protein
MMDLIVLGGSALVAVIFSLLVWKKLLAQSIYALLLLSLFVFDFAWISLDRIEELHLSKEQAMVQKIEQISQDLLEKDKLLSEMARLQAELTVFTLSQKNPTATYDDQKRKLIFRNELLPKMAEQGIEPEAVLALQKQIDQSIHDYLFADFSDELMQTLGRKGFIAFYRRYDRSEWTDSLFLEQAKGLLMENQQLVGDIAQKLMRVERYDQDQKLLLNGVSPVE